MPRVNKNKNFLFFVLFMVLSSVFLVGSVFYIKNRTNLDAKAIQSEPVIHVAEAAQYMTETRLSDATKVVENKDIQVSQISPDGLYLLTVKSQELLQTQKKVDIFVRDEEKQTDTIVFTYQTNSGTSIEIPFNTWSPDNKYFFIS